MNFKVLLGLSPAILGLLSCQNPVSSESDIQHIHGKNDLVWVEDGGRDILGGRFSSRLDAIGRMTGGCTGTHIGNSIVMTAAHCFQMKSGRIDAEGICAKEAFKVEWGKNSGKTPLVARCTQVLDVSFDSIGKPDYAFFKVDKAPPSNWPLETGGKVASGTSLTIFGYPVTKEAFSRKAGKMVDLNQQLVWSGTCPAERATRASDGTNITGMLSYLCDTLSGNSGAPVIDVTKGTIVGIHSAGVTNYNIGTFIQDSSAARLLKK